MDFHQQQKRVIQELFNQTDKIAHAKSKEVASKNNTHSKPFVKTKSKSSAARKKLYRANQTPEERKQEKEANTILKAKIRAIQTPEKKKHEKEANTIFKANLHATRDS